MSLSRIMLIVQDRLGNELKGLRDEANKYELAHSHLSESRNHYKTDRVRQNQQSDSGTAKRTLCRDEKT